MGLTAHNVGPDSLHIFEQGLQNLQSLSVTDIGYIYFYYGQFTIFVLPTGNLNLNSYHHYYSIFNVGCLEIFATFSFSVKVCSEPQI